MACSPRAAAAARARLRLRLRLGSGSGSVRARLGLGSGSAPATRAPPPWQRARPPRPRPRRAARAPAAVSPEQGPGAWEAGGPRARKAWLSSAGAAARLGLRAPGDAAPSAGGAEAVAGARRERFGAGPLGALSDAPAPCRWAALGPRRPKHRTTPAHHSAALLSPHEPLRCSAYGPVAGFGSAACEPCPRLGPWLSEHAGYSPNPGKGGTPTRSSTGSGLGPFPAASRALVSGGYGPGSQFPRSQALPLLRGYTAGDP
ncbi:spidroin-2-like [Mustela lutreola]|uniref:spidroin-2-like n=1 Tax=Mustela lutreola TaxID=9666 RepID=UPI0027979247|nr:spidroin-2-like [Mustela lutreola]